MVFAEGSVSELGVAEFGTDYLKPSVRLSGPEGATVSEHELIGREASVFSAQEPDRQWLTTGRLSDRLPNVALEEVDCFGGSGGLFTKRGRCGR